MSSFHGKKDWGRLLTAMLTPFDASGAVNYSEAARLATYLVDVQKNDGIVVNGTTGESPTLKESEKLRLLEVVIEAVGDRAAVVFGAGSYDTEESLHMVREGERRGADGIMLVNPYYSRPGQAGLYAHFSTLARATGLSVMLYNIMPRAAINLETSTLLRLTEISNIVAVKEASGNLAQIADVCAQTSDSFRVYSGDDGLTLPILSVGGYGLVSVIAHVAGDRLKKMIEIFPNDPKAATEIHQSLIPLTKSLFAAPSPVPVKYATSRIGFDAAHVRLPLVALEPSEKEAVDAALRGLGIGTATVAAG